VDSLTDTARTEATETAETAETTETTETDRRIHSRTHILLHTNHITSITMAGSTKTPIKVVLLDIGTYMCLRDE
jgi:hypothetical protein